MQPKKKKSLALPSINSVSQNTINPSNMSDQNQDYIPPLTQSQPPDDTALAAKQPLGDQSYDGWCQKFVEHVTDGKTGQYASAIDAWNKQQDKAVAGLQGIKVGDPIYFSSDQSNDGYGHAGVAVGNNKFISATDTGIKTYDIKDWENLTGQKVLGYLKKK